MTPDHPRLSFAQSFATSCQLTHTAGLLGLRLLFGPSSSNQRSATHCCRPSGLPDLMLAEVERLLDLNAMLRPFVSAPAGFPVEAAHHEFARGDEHKLHARLLQPDPIGPSCLGVSLLARAGAQGSRTGPCRYPAARRPSRSLAVVSPIDC